MHGMPTLLCPTDDLTGFNLAQAAIADCSTLIQLATGRSRWVAEALSVRGSAKSGLKDYLVRCINSHQAVTHHACCQCI